MRILICPAHYLFSNKYGSEPLWAYEIVTNLATKVDKLDVLVGVIDIETSNDFPPNVRIISIFKGRSTNVFIEFFKRLLFYPLVFVHFLWLRKNNYDVVHHLFPLSIATFNPVIVFIKFFDKKVKTVMGPLQLPQTVGAKNEIGVVLTGKPSKNLSTMLITGIYTLLIIIIKPFALFMLRQSNQVICNSLTSEDYYKQTFGLTNTCFIPTGVHYQAFNSCIKKTDQLNILCVGQLSERKGQIYLLKAFNVLCMTFPNINLIIVGDGPMRNSYEEFVKKYKLEKKVNFTGWLKPKDVEYYYKNSNIFCLSSLSDPSPTVLLEAMMYALPIVAFDVGSVKEMVKNAGLVVTPQDTNALAHAIEMLILDDDLRVNSGNNGHTNIVDNYTWKVIVNQYINLYQNL